MARANTNSSASVPRSSFGKLKIAVIIFLSLWFGWWFFHPIDLIPADLGRHITNGRIILTNLNDLGKILRTNYYSFATPNAPFVNHHWLTGVIFFVVWKLVGFTGLGLFHILVNLAAFLLIFRLTVKRAGFTVASLTAIFLIPLLAERTEIRPEIFTYLLIALYLTILIGVTEGWHKPKILWWLVPLQILWVNLHIYFFLGPCLIGLYWLAGVFKKLPVEKLTRPPGRASGRRPLWYALLGTVLACLLNPNGWQGLIYPALIFTNYGFVTSENQSIATVEAAGQGYANFLIFKLALAALILAYGRIIIKRRAVPRAAELIMAALFALWAFFAIRNLTIFGYVALLTLAAALRANFKPLVPDQKLLSVKQYLIIGLALLSLAVGISYSRIIRLAPQTRLGLVTGNSAAADFINQHNLTGPLFNDFDIGGYATFYLFPRVQPFIDNRPEAFPPGFIQTDYIIPQTPDAAWQTNQTKYNFNLILYSYEDKAPWATQFIVARLLDPDWAPVYTDNFAIVFLRRAPANAAFIKQYEISKERFSLGKN